MESTTASTAGGAAQQQQQANASPQDQQKKGKQERPSVATTIPRPSVASVASSGISFASSSHGTLTGNGTTMRSASASDAAPAVPAATGSEERQGLTSAQAAERLEQYGPNAIPKIETPIWKMILQQFTGLMPLMLEISCLVSAIAEDWPDLGVIAGMLFVNAALGFREEMKAKRALDELTNSMESSVTCLRDGAPCVLGVTKLVPGDVIHMRGGTLTPADVDWLEGDILQINTAAVTGEPLPRKYPSDEYGRFILSGCTVTEGEAYCVVRKTGTNTEIGRGQADIAADRTSASVSVFEQKVMVVVNIIIAIAVLDCIVLVIVQGLARDGFSSDNRKKTLLSALSILIAAVPVALPLVLQVTMAIGAYRMATSHNAIVTRMSALQDIASMDILCSDKTGTLTTAKMSIQLDQIWPAADAGFEVLGLNKAKLETHQQMLMVMAYLASNPDKKDDAVDGAVIRAFEKMEQERGGLMNTLAGYRQMTLKGFNPEVKRTVAQVSEERGKGSRGRKLIIAKGLATKVLNTAAGGTDTAEHQWKCAELNNIPGFEESVKRQDEQLASKGYKTIAVAVGVEGEAMHFLGLLPMIDPPRSDTAKTIRRIQDAGVEVKMITGDHLNIAIETARLVGMPLNILPGEMTREASYTRDELIRGAGGFAQVLPRDKRECVLALQRSFQFVVGMTGDGVNDAPALSAAQCGIAVDDATDAAKGAAAMILTTEGLSAVFGAIVESRKIFNRLFSYISYRLASTIQILLYLSILVYVFDCRLNPLYVVLLALFNDITMIPVAEDRQTASAAPQHADVKNLIGFSVMLGVMQSVTSIVYYLCMHLGLVSFAGHTEIYPTSQHAQVAIWLQVSIAAELLIFAARAPGLFFLSRPSWQLLASTTLGNIISTILAKYVFSHPLNWREIGIIWAWDIAGLFIVDIAKMFYKYIFEHNVAGIIDEAALKEEDASEAREARGDDLAAPLTSTANPHHGSRTQRSSFGSITEFMATGRAPYVRPHGSDANRHARSGALHSSQSLHPRTPAMVAQARSLFGSF
jgi:H+-transporting ATPase